MHKCSVRNITPLSQCPLTHGLRLLPSPRTSASSLTCLPPPPIKSEARLETRTSSRRPKKNVPPVARAHAASRHFISRPDNFLIAPFPRRSRQSAGSRRSSEPSVHPVAVRPGKRPHHQLH